MAEPLNNLLAQRRLFILLGPYGAGKTELAINLALRLAASGRHTALCDLDIVNPYFRSREKEEALAQAGVRLIAPPKSISAADLPAIPGELWAVVRDQQLAVVLDAGGDPVGARVLASFDEPIIHANPEVWYVVNRARLRQRPVEEALAELRQIEASCQLSVTGLVNNTHLLHETDMDTVRAGADFADALSKASGIPVLFHAVREDLAQQANALGEVLPLRLHMARPWEEGPNKEEDL